MLIFHIGIAFIDMTHPDKAKYNKLQDSAGFSRVFFGRRKPFSVLVFSHKYFPPAQIKNPLRFFCLSG